jgi:rod shape-determining protein MreD
MKFFVTVGLALLLLTLEAVVVQRAGLVLSRIDVTVVLLAFLALRATLMEGACSAFAVGYLLDMMSGKPTGLFTFLGVFTFLVCRLVYSLVEVRGPIAFVLFTMGADVGHGLLAAFFGWLTVKDGSATAVLPGLPLQVALTGIAALALYPLLRRFEVRQERSQVGGLL